MHTVDEIMSTNVRTAKMHDVVGPLRDLMQDEHLHAVPVIDDRGELVGIVTSSDLVEEWSPTMGVSSVMSSSDVCTVGPHTSVVDAARAMVDRRVHHLVVVDRGHVVGIVSSFDLVRHLAARVEQLTGAPAAPTGVLRANVGDVIVVLPKHLGERERRATVVTVHGEGGTAPFTVRWADDPHDQPRLALFFPSNDAHVERATVR